MRRIPKRKPRKRIPRRRSKLRNGRVVNEAFMRFAHEHFGCFVASAGGCGGLPTFHHVKHGWELKDDTFGLMLCTAHHQHDGGPESLERLGRKKWQERFGVVLEEAAQSYRMAYLEAGHTL